MTALNSKALDTEALNTGSTAIPSDGTFNSYIMNGLTLDGTGVSSSFFATVAAFDCIVIPQKVGIHTAASNAVLFEEDVEFRNAFTGTVIKVVQQVKTITPSTTISIQQSVLDKTANTFFNRNGWTAVLTMNGYVIPEDRIFKDIVIKKEENQPNQCTFALLVPDPVEFIDAFWGKPVTVDYVDSTGSTRVFTGILTMPEIDIINKNVKITCTNDRDNFINATMGAVVPTIGLYSEAILGVLTTVGVFGGSVITTPAEELNMRMQTLQYSLDFDSYNVYHLNSWFTKSTADYTFTDADIYYRTPKVVWQDRTKVKNNFTIAIAYTYTRLYQYAQPFSWTFPYTFCTFLANQYSLPNIKMVETAISSAKWVLTAPIIFTSVFPPGSCAYGGTQILFWNTSSFANKGTQSTIFDSLGNVISDPDGNNVYGFKPFTNQDDLSKIYTIGANWIGATFFSQYIEEDYTLNVYSTQSINQFGSVVDSTTASVKDSYDASPWESQTTIPAVPANAVFFAGGSYYSNQDTDIPGVVNGVVDTTVVNTEQLPSNQLLSEAIVVAVERAKASLLSTHRNTQVIVETPIKPHLELSHTIAIAATKLATKGKVQIITHTLGVGEGRGSKTEVTLALFRSQGTATTTPTFVPARPVDAIDIPSYPIVLGSEFGITDKSFDGYIGNKNNPRVIGQLVRTNVQEEFRVDTPPIPDAYRALRQLPVTANYEVFIPNDDLEVTL